ncbi:MULTISPECIES: LLM class flavin-dependent oxidoreductase [Empedobacter]|uniref:LLM class flavin-dependent oxidoreductase n=1 Tax=Empedobacter TaxID=59734 RepID=UPI000E811198|nr:MULTISPECIES: LLM class flavin-dependent oxidoreductase [Empedobacter]MBW1619298.1 LLM class flavin-dependent oxidoreductase [Empedobacter falsenii]MDM1139723.1 LLM class flavin-dependent oxidoreductase [Empedobacter sp. R132-2]HBX61515.1 LLM class flavin-dependent oxidoreductase [Flavobacteriaceae bacterium]
MELGIGMFGDLHIDPKTGYTQTPQQRMSEIIEEVKLMDEIGLDFFGIGEHHRPDYAVSSPEIILAALSTVTKNIKLGSAVSVISSTDPVKLYQDFASVDNLSNGRAEIMAGRGSFIESFPLFGYDLNDYDALFDEKLRLLLDLNKNEVINWRGKFRMPIINQSVYPKPVQEKLPIWIAVGGTKSSIVRAATLGLPIIFAIIGGNPADFNYLFEIYKQVYIENGHDIKTMQIGVHMHSFFGEDSEKIAEEYFPIYGAQMNRIGASRGWPKYTKPQFDYGRSTNGHLIVGDASLAVDRILKYQEMFGLTRFSAHMDVGAPNHLDMMKSIEIFGKDILPKVKM